MTELEFCEYWGEPLEDMQRQMVEHHVREGTFVGVGRAVGRMVFWPLMSRGDGKVQRLCTKIPQRVVPWNMI